MGRTVRFGVSMDESLTELLDEWALKQGHPNRSEAIRGLVRQELTTLGSKAEDQPVIATVTLLYHHGTLLPRAPIAAFPSIHISFNVQVHLEQDICAKVLIVSGRSDEIRSWSSKLLCHHGVIGRLNIAATNELFRELRQGS
ncbi:MAG: hypothetical protein A3J97_16975 [Spirochaetes bacterium RIFOXYC1_FULL_54_7]|nr:MAG: hypothetical protein A3J97_16975 [Spirochaetes bacterium RIFOXYC1_FULL_54_7]